MRITKLFRTRLITDNRGGSLVELVMVMLLLILFGATIYTLIYTGGETLAKIIQVKNTQVEARIAMSYLNVRLKQNDASGSITIVQNPADGRNVIVLKDSIDGMEVDTWIYWSGGMLKEALLYPGEALADEPGMYTPIAAVSGFETRLNPDGSVTNTIYYETGETTHKLETETFLRASPTFSAEAAQ